MAMSLGFCFAAAPAPMDTDGHRIRGGAHEGSLAGGAAAAVVDHGMAELMHVGDIRADMLVDVHAQARREVVLESQRDGQVAEGIHSRDGGTAVVVTHSDLKRKIEMSVEVILETAREDELVPPLQAA